MRYLPAKTSVSSRERFHWQFEQLQELRSELAVHQPFEGEALDLDLSAYYALLRENEKLGKQLARLTDKISHIK